MGKPEFEKGLQLQRIAALPYNPFFEDEIKGIRQRYAIPADSTKAKSWFGKLLLKYERSALALLYQNIDKQNIPYLTPAVQLDFGEQLRNEIARRSRQMHTLLETEVPLERDILLLLRRFRIPLALYFFVLQYTLTGDKSWLHPVHMRPNAHCDFPVEIGEIASLRVIVTGLFPWTTKEEWDDLWEGTVKDCLEDIDAFLCGRKFHRKRPLQESLYMRFKQWYHSYQMSLNKQMKRWSEWYQLSETEGLGPKQALEEWEKEHEDQRGKFDPSTIAKAIKSFREIITPIPIND